MRPSGGIGRLRGAVVAHKQDGSILRMKVFVLSRFEKKPGDCAAGRLLAFALAEAAIRGGFSDALEALWPLEAAEKVPDDAIVWIIGSREEAAAVCDVLAARHRGGAAAGGPDGALNMNGAPDGAGLAAPRIFLTPRHTFWDDPLGPPPPLDDPCANTKIAPFVLPGGLKAGEEPIDWLAAFAWILQRAEEYDATLPRDMHGRYLVEHSELHRRQWLDRPVADEIALRIGDRLKSVAARAEGSAAKTPPQKPLSSKADSLLLALTHDVDSLRYWTWGRAGQAALGQLRGKGRGADPGADATAGGKTGPVSALRAAIRSARRPESDPHWTFEWLRRWERERRVRPTVFVLPERRTSMDYYDLRRAGIKTAGKQLAGEKPVGEKPAPGREGRFAEQLRLWRGEGAEIGLHPPYDSLDHPERFASQRGLLEAALSGITPNSAPNSDAVSTARFHWLRLRIPDSWAALARAGIRADSSLGHAKREGFRAGTAHPFLALDLRTARPAGISTDSVGDSAAALVEVPLIAMDVTLRHHHQLRPEEASARIESLAASCRRVGGTFVLLWHTNSFDPGDWAGWRTVFERAVESALEHGARSETIGGAAERHRAALAVLLRRLLPEYTLTLSVK